MADLTRGELLRRGAAAAGAVAVSGVPTARATSGSFDGTIRIATIGFDLLPSIVSRAERNLGLRILPEYWESSSELHRLVWQEPAAFDILFYTQQSINPLWPSGNLKPVEIAKISQWNEVSRLLKLGKLRPGDRRCTYGPGDAAFRRLYLDPERSGQWRNPTGTSPELEGLIVQWADEKTGLPVGPEPRFCTGVPGWFNFDSFGYNTHVIRKRPEDLSWAELLNERWRGRIALMGDAIGGPMDFAIAARAAGLVRIRDIGDLTRREIDLLFKLLTALWRRKLFFGFWSIASEAEKWMKSRHVVIEGMWAVSITPLQVLGFPVSQAAPREGYRAFAGFYSISSAVTDPAKLRACYDFLNWWNSGFAGREMMRSGFLNAVAAASRRFMPADEYAYWLEGKPAARNYKSPTGDIVARKGQVRDGGPFTRRACRIALWNTWPRESDHLHQRWFEFASKF